MPRCPDPIHCEIVGCSWPAKCRPQALAVTPPPIPLRFGQIDPMLRRGNLARITDRLARVLRGPPASPPPPAMSEPFLLAAPPAPKAPLPVSDPLVLDGSMFPAPVPATPAGKRPTVPAQLVPARLGGFALIIEGNFVAVARTPDEVADMAREWASGAFL